MKRMIEVLEKRPYQLTENYFGISKYPTCTRPGCMAEATEVVVMKKFDCIFHEPMCPDHAARFELGLQEMSVKPSSYMQGLAKFYQVDVNVLLDLPEDDRAVLQKFADAYRKDDFDAITELTKDKSAKALIKQFFKPELEE